MWFAYSKFQRLTKHPTLHLRNRVNITGKFLYHNYIKESVARNKHKETFNHLPTNLGG